MALVLDSCSKQIGWPWQINHFTGKAVRSLTATSDSNKPTLQHLFFAIGDSVPVGKLMVSFKSCRCSLRYAGRCGAVALETASYSDSSPNFTPSSRSFAIFFCSLALAAAISSSASA